MTAFILQILCFTQKIGPARQVPTLQNHQISRFRQATRTITLFAENQNFNKLSSQLNPQQIPDPNTLSNSKPKGRTRCVQNYQSSRFRQTMRMIALFAENQISTNYPNNLIPTKLLSNTKFKRRTQRVQDPVTPFTKTFKIVFQRHTKVIQALKSHSETKSDLKYFKNSKLTSPNPKPVRT